MKKLLLALSLVLLPLFYSYGALGDTVEKESCSFTTAPKMTKKVDSHLTQILWDEQGVINVIGFLDGVSVFYRKAKLDGSPPLSQEDLTTFLSGYSERWFSGRLSNGDLKILISEDGNYAVTYGEEKGVGKNVFTLMSIKYLRYMAQKSNTITI